MQKSKKLTRSQVEILYSQSAVTFLFPSFIAIVLAATIWEVADRTALLAWLAVVFLYSIFRYVMLWKYNKTELTPENVEQWLNIFIASACVSGVMWGLAVIILIPTEGKSAIEFTLYSGITLLAVSGLVAGATISYAVNLSVLLFYIFPALLPPSMYMISRGDVYSSALGGFVLLYCFFVGTAGYRMNRQLLFYISKQHELSKLKRQHQKLLLMYEKLSGTPRERRKKPRTKTAA